MMQKHSQLLPLRYLGFIVYKKLAFYFPMILHQIRKRATTMKRKRRLFSCVILVVLSIGCASSADSPRSWEGISQSELIAQWGEPDKIIANDPEGRVLVYSRENGSSSQPSDDLYRYGSGTKESDIPGDAANGKVIYMFWTDNKGIVYRWTEKN
jgi:hypothetical protein